MDENIIDYLTRTLSSQVGEFLPLDSVPNYLSHLSKKQRAYLKKIGWKNFLNTHPNNFAIIDDVVVLIHNSTSDQYSSSDVSTKSSLKPASSSSKKDDIPSDAAIESIKKDFEKSKSCGVCADQIEIYAYGTCFHPICYKCSTKLRVLCDDKHCPICRRSLSQVVFSTKLTPLHKTTSMSSYIKEKYGIKFEGHLIHSKYRVLLEHKCAKVGCDKKYDDFDDLKRHMQEKHGEYFCQLCVKQCKIFTHDRKTYSSIELQEHEEGGDEGLGSAHQGHPLCQFCNSRYLDRDELLRHLQQHHCSCHICVYENHVFYADNDDLWHHFSVEHFVCSEQECFGTKHAAFKTEEELQNHKAKEHTGKKGKFTKRQEQPIALDVTYGTGGGLQFGRPSRTFEMAFTPLTSSIIDGNLRCTGQVINVTSCYGFIRRDDCPGNFVENIFFCQCSYGLDESEDLTKHFRIGDRVHVTAKPMPYHRSKWRAIGVSKISNVPHVGLGAIFDSDRQRTDSISSSLTNGTVELEVANIEESFPALPTITPAEQSSSSNNNTVNWSTVVKTRKQPAKPPNPVNPTVSTSPPRPQAVVNDKNSLTGVGEVHYHLQPSFGFITRPGTAFEENIYFNLQAYIAGSGKLDVRDLTKELNINQKVCYELEEPGKVKRQTKAKYRAVKVWQFKPNKANVPAAQSPSRLNNNVSPKRSPEHSISALKSISQPSTTRNPAVSITESPSTSKNMGLDDFDASPPKKNMDSSNLVNGVVGVYPALQSRNGNDETYLLRDVVGMFLHGDKEDSLIELSTELEINGLDISEIAYFRFAEGEEPEVHSVLLSGEGDTNPTHKTFILSSIGFESEALSVLKDRKMLVIGSENLYRSLYYVKNSNIYITCKKDERRTDEIYLHTSFRRM